MHQSDEFRYSTRDLQVQKMLLKALWKFAKYPAGEDKKSINLAIREYNKLSVLKKKRRQ